MGTNDSATLVVVGDALIDEIRDDAGTREFVGGAALNVAVGLSRLGHETTLIAMVGDDEAGERIRAHLAEHGVRLLASSAPHGTARAVSTRVDGEPQYEFNRAARERLIAFDDEALRAVEEADLVAVSCVAFDRAAQVDEFARAFAGVRLAVDPNPRSGMMSDRAAFVEGFARFTAGADLVKVGDDDAELLEQGSLDAFAAALAAQGVRAVAATRGADGASLLAAGGSVDRPIADLPGPVIDTMGAGDAVFAALIAALVERDEPDWETAVERALAIAAATVRREGALLQLP
ncbi:PfkB family carbohydrate kinase [Microbacterium sp. gxy059]|uniref:PfkB family carbohydrate kinase n=1 Tax=Microbacterium sp. gxy059 TaxID=2957199 RepID=UPI003D95AE07